jgi:hypothetical protein
MPLENGNMNPFHPFITKWFAQRFAAPTGSGKTLAAFLSCLDRLIRDGISGELTDRTHVVYISPLKALSQATFLIVPDNESARGCFLVCSPIHAAISSSEQHAVVTRSARRKPQQRG